MNSSHSPIVFIALVVIGIVLFAASDQQSRRVFCWLFILGTLFLIGYYSMNPALFLHDMPH